MCRSCSCLYRCLRTTYISGAHRSRNRAMDLLVLELWTIVNCHVGARSQIQALCKNKTCHQSQKIFSFFLIKNFNIIYSDHKQYIYLKNYIYIHIHISVDRDNFQHIHLSWSLCLTPSRPSQCISLPTLLPFFATSH